jgi:hypothetical protein
VGQAPALEGVGEAQRRTTPGGMGGPWEERKRGRVGVVMLPLAITRGTKEW